jgi:hypothetical protein
VRDGPVTFFLSGERELERLAALDADADWRELQTGERAWILQTFLRLRRRGAPVELAAAVPPGGLVVFHSKHERALRRAARGAPGAVLVGVRADNRQALAAEFELLQNGRWADGRRRFAVAHWPQPGLQPRDPRRGDRLECVAYKGFVDNLAAEFRGEAWRRELEALGVAWQLDAVEFRGAATDPTVARWADYREVDAVLAVRPARRGREHSKPATKLTNAWLAGVPALLGPEFAFRELRRSPLDYLEVDDVAAARAAVARLRAEPGLYRAMVAHGAARAASFDADAVARQWEALLFERLPARAARRGATLGRRWPLALRRIGRWLARTASLRPPR